MINIFENSIRLSPLLVLLSYNDGNSELKQNMEISIELGTEASIKEINIIASKIVCNIETKNYIQCIVDLNLVSSKFMRMVYLKKRNFTEYLITSKFLLGKLYSDDILINFKPKMKFFNCQKMYFHNLEAYSNKNEEARIDSIIGYNDSLINYTDNYTNKTYNKKDVDCCCFKCKSNYINVSKFKIIEIPLEEQLCFYDFVEYVKSKNVIVAKIQVCAIVFYTPSDEEIINYDLMKYLFEDIKFVKNEIKKNKTQKYYFIYNIEYSSADNINFYKENNTIVKAVEKFNKKNVLSDNELLNLFDETPVSKKIEQKPKKMKIQKKSIDIPLITIVEEPVALQVEIPQLVVEPVIEQIEKFKLFSSYNLVFSEKSKFNNKELIFKMLEDYYNTSESFYIYLKQFSTITIIKDIHNSHMFYNIPHFNLIFNSANLTSKIFHANLKKNVITSITEINKL